MTSRASPFSRTAEFPSGGGDYPVDGLKEVYNEQVEVRQALIDWVKAKQVVDPADFFDENWQVVTSNRTPGGPDDDDASGTSDSSGSGNDGSSDRGDTSGEAGAEDDDPTDSTSNGSASADNGEAGGSAADAGGGPDLPRTGIDLGASIGIAAAIIALGTSLVLIVRRRRS